MLLFNALIYKMLGYDTFPKNAEKCHKSVIEVSWKAIQTAFSIAQKR